MSQEEEALSDWDRMIAELECYVREHQDFPHHNARIEFPDQQVERLVGFVRMQRRSRYLLTDRQRSCLEQIPGFSWDPLAEAWTANVSDWGQHFALHGRAPSPSSTSVRDRQLARWASEQRRRQRNGTIALNRLKEVTAIPGWSWVAVAPPLDSFNARLEELRGWIAQNGRFPNVATNRPSDPEGALEHSLARWLYVQQYADQRRRPENRRQSKIEAAIGPLIHNSILDTHKPRHID
ncbi:hypothetical protein [Marisediminicola antarctica]|uniref:hypothetical protein n=1 Tax=Marisediminicola antarctica TaxID=674079 RepID=UPI00137B270C|nr:hypothetical protein [Marisediminicola antarctica]